MVENGTKKIGRSILREAAKAAYAAKAGRAAKKIGRIVVTTNWHGTEKEVASAYAAYVKDAKAKSVNVTYLITRGGFLEFPWPSKIGRRTNTVNPSADDLACLKGFAKDAFNKLLANPVMKEVKKVARYITVGIDSTNKNVTRIVENGVEHITWNPINLIEFVVMYDFKTGDEWWTGKIYPTPSQQKQLLRIPGVESHFVETEDDRVMLLGCHDLNLWSPRGDKSAKGWRLDLKNAFKSEAKHFKPNVVLQHPHWTDTPGIWRQALSMMRNTVPSVTHFASAGAWFDPNREKQRKPLQTTLSGTMFGSVHDFTYGTQ